MCSQKLSKLHCIIHWYQKLTFMPFPFKMHWLAEVLYLFIRCNKATFFLWKTKNTNRNGVNKQNNTGNRGVEVPAMSQITSNFFLFFLTVQKKEVTKPPLFWTWALSLNKNQLFFDKILHVNVFQVKKISFNVPHFL